MRDSAADFAGRDRAGAAVRDAGRRGRHRLPCGVPLSSDLTARPAVHDRPKVGTREGPSPDRTALVRLLALPAMARGRARYGRRRRAARRRSAPPPASPARSACSASAMPSLTLLERQWIRPRHGRCSAASMRVVGGLSISPRPGAAAADAAPRRGACSRARRAAACCEIRSLTGRSSDSSTSSQRSDGRCAAMVLSRISSGTATIAPIAPHIQPSRRDGHEHRHGVERAAPADEGRRHELQFGEVDQRSGWPAPRRCAASPRR